ncbi:carboxylesterase family protein [Streptomyces sp. NPDC005878]|uniref:carboxylesterase/lipase family protein n=1 Tax=Streptomyces sp. NPDC005878 TaxID=3157077 RepID=UPI0033E427DD
MADSAMGRRAVLAATAAAAAGAGAAGVAGAAPAAARPSAARPVAGARPGGPVVVRTAAGPVAGAREGGALVFRGVPYAQPPLGALRFASPRPPRPWRGVRDATRFAPPFLQTVDPAGSEDGLYANVWTPGTRGRRPVLVYIHGGGWQVGAGSWPTYDGRRLALRGDLVVITFNYRMGAFGFGYHEELTDDRTGDCANWGLQDQAALLRWVRENAGAFGGDPADITLAGTSAGGASAWQLALRPELRGLIRRIVPISACHVWAPATSLTVPDARRVYEEVAARLGTTVRGLRAAPAAAVQDAWFAVFSGAPGGRVVGSGREYRGPVVDGRWMRAFDHELATPAVPVLSVHTRTEGSFYTGPGSPIPTPAPTDDASLRDAVRGVLLKGAARVSDSLVDGCVDAYRAAAVAEGLPLDPVSLWTDVWGDGLFRYLNVRLAERHARTGTAPGYLMEFAHPARPPWFGTPHEHTSPFLFGTYGLPGNVGACGDGAGEVRVGDAFMDLVASFAHTGVPTAPGVPPWPPFAPGRASALILGEPGGARVAEVSKGGQLGFWDGGGWGPRVLG